MSAPDPHASLPPRLRTLVTQLEALGGVVRRADAIALLARAGIELEDVSPFVEESPHGYARRRIARTEAFELLVMTWRPGQGSVPHDHAGSLCAMRVVRGRLRETLFVPARDGLVDPTRSGDASACELLVDTSEHVHALGNDADATEPSVTLHLYSPPLAELRRFALRPSGAEVPVAFTRARAPGARTVTVVGGGVSGTLVAAHLLRGASERGRPLHVVLIDRQAAFGEGAAYRTADPRHLLNVPASNMSAWPDRPDDFRAWASSRLGPIAPSEFVARRRYGEYVREQLHGVASRAGEHVSAEVRRDEATAIRARPRGWTIECEGASIESDAVVIATGHRPPDCPLEGRWTGSRARYVEDPWASLALTAIGPDERVVLLGTGLTAVDVLLTLTRTPRTAPVIAISRRGLSPAAHLTVPVARRDPTPWLEPLLARPGGPTTRALLRAIRQDIVHADDWRSVIDGLRPHTARIWASLSEHEVRRFLRHARAFWEVARHRTAPAVAGWVDALVAREGYRTIAARPLGARADRDGVDLDVRERGAAVPTTLRASWIVNCTGPGAGLTPVVRSLVDAGHLARDVHGLGVLTDEDGRARVHGSVRGDLVLVGTLRKPQLWESTAVPELRAQAAEAARILLDALA